MLNRGIEFLQAILSNEKKALNDHKSSLLKNYKLVDFKVYGSKAKGTQIFADPRTWNLDPRT